MTNITINTKNTKKRGNGMKKILAILLAIITVFAMSIPAFAADETAKDVDNTFDNYTPSFGQRAPENWYDPYCYDEDGTISFLALDGSYESCAAVYCTQYNKIYRDHFVVVNGYILRPYTYLTGEYGQWGEEKGYYCPYCGEDEDSATHVAISTIVYGGLCPECGEFTASANLLSGSASEPHILCTHCSKNFYLSSYDVKLYRFLTEEQRTSEYSHIFEETAYKYGDGEDCKSEELVKSGLGTGLFKEWNSENNPNYKPSFGEKIANFFKSVGDFFVNIIKWFQKLFGIVK